MTKKPNHNKPILNMEEDDIGNIPNSHRPVLLTEVVASGSPAPHKIKIQSSAKPSQYKSYDDDDAPSMGFSTDSRMMDFDNKQGISNFN